MDYDFRVFPKQFSVMKNGQGILVGLLVIVMCPLTCAKLQFPLIIASPHFKILTAKGIKFTQKKKSCEMNNKHN